MDSTCDQVLQVSGRVPLRFCRQCYKIQRPFCVDLEVPRDPQPPLYYLRKDLPARILVRRFEVHDLFKHV